MPEARVIGFQYLKESCSQCTPQSYIPENSSGSGYLEWGIRRMCFPFPVMADSIPFVLHDFYPEEHFNDILPNNVSSSIFQIEEEGTRLFVKTRHLRSITFILYQKLMSDSFGLQRTASSFDVFIW
ncbi:hypothetical protein DINM_003380 [Dirofilaria immitis]|nr:hypothetical protein [Dirofilaria immitis]